VPIEKQTTRMAKSKSWSVKGIDGETRDIARDAAQAAGMTIGAWIDHAILKAKRGELPGLAIPGTNIATVKAPEPAALAVAPGSAEVPIEPVAPSAPSLFPSPSPPPPITPIRTPAGAIAAETTPASIPASVPVSIERSDAEPRNGPSRPDAFIDGGADQNSDAGYAGPKPLAPSQPRASAGHYAILAVAFLALLGGGIWLFVELSSTEKMRAPQTAAAPQPATPGRIAEPAPSATPAAPNGAAPALPDEIRTGIELARAGNAKAQHDLGMLHLSGRYVKKDSAKAASWFERAAIQGLASAQFNLGVLYQRGEGVAQNDRLALFWYQSAAE
jgi:hypothetical protein